MPTSCSLTWGRSQGATRGNREQRGMAKAGAHLSGLLAHPRLLGLLSARWVRWLSRAGISQQKQETAMILRPRKRGTKDGVWEEKHNKVRSGGAAQDRIAWRRMAQNSGEQR